MRGRLPTFAAVVRYGLISSFSSADVCRRLSAEPSHGENRGSSPLGSASYFSDLTAIAPLITIFGEFLGTVNNRGLSRTYRRRFSALDKLAVGPLDPTDVRRVTTAALLLLLR